MLESWHGGYITPTVEDCNSHKTELLPHFHLYTGPSLAAAIYEYCLWLQTHATPVHVNSQRFTLRHMWRQHTPLQELVSVPDSDSPVQLEIRKSLFWIVYDVGSMWEKKVTECNPSIFLKKTEIISERKPLNTTNNYSTAKFSDSCGRDSRRAPLQCKTGQLLWSGQRTYCSIVQRFSVILHPCFQKTGELRLRCSLSFCVAYRKTGSVRGRIKRRFLCINKLN
jgi:hypothetical protein